MPVLFTRAPMAAESHSCSEMASSRERSRKAAASSSHGKALSRLSRFTATPIASSAMEHTSMRQDDSQVGRRSEEHTSELQSLLRISYAVISLKKKKTTDSHNNI